MFWVFCNSDVKDVEYLQNKLSSFVFGFGFFLRSCDVLNGIYGKNLFFLAYTLRLVIRRLKQRKIAKLPPVKAEERLRQEKEKIRNYFYSWRWFRDASVFLRRVKRRRFPRRRLRKFFCAINKTKV